MTLIDVARLRREYGIGRDSSRKLLKEVGAIRLGHRFVATEADLEAWIKSQQAQQAASTSSPQ